MTIQEQAKQLAESLLNKLKESAKKSGKSRSPIILELPNYYLVKDTQSKKALWIKKDSLTVQLEKQMRWEVDGEIEIHTALVDLSNTDIIPRAKTFYQDDYYEI